MTTAPTCPFDHTKIRNTIWTSGLTVNETAFRVHMPAKHLQHIVDGKTDPIDIRLDTLKRLADHLGLPLRSLFAESDPPPEPATDEPPEVATDATTVIALLYDRGSTPTINHDLARALGWDLTRLLAAYDEAERRLAPAGLRLIRTHGEGSIVPAHDHTATRAAVTQAQSESTPTTINLDAYKATYQVLTGAPVLPDSKGTRRRILLGKAGRLGMIDLRPRTPTLTQAATEAFLD